MKRKGRNRERKSAITYFGLYLIMISTILMIAYGIIQLTLEQNVKNKAFDELKAKFGNKLVPLSWPLSAEIDDELKEAIAESDEELMEKYFDGEEFTDEEIKKGMVKGISEGNIGI